MIPTKPSLPEIQAANYSNNFWSRIKPKTGPSVITGACSDDLRQESGVL